MTVSMGEPPPLDGGHRERSPTPRSGVMAPCFKVPLAGGILLDMLSVDMKSEPFIWQCRFYTARQKMLTTAKTEAYQLKGSQCRTVQ